MRLAIRKIVGDPNSPPLHAFLVEKRRLRDINVYFRVSPYLPFCITYSAKGINNAPKAMLFGPAE